MLIVAKLSCYFGTWLVQKSHYQSEYLSDRMFSTKRTCIEEEYLGDLKGLLCVEAP